MEEQPNTDSGQPSIGDSKEGLENQIENWRKELLQNTLSYTLGIAFVASLVAIWQIYVGRLVPGTAYFLAVGDAIIATAYFLPTRHYSIRIRLLVSEFYFLGLLGSFGGIVSLYGAGFVGLIAMSALFLGKRSALWSMAICVLHTLLLSLAFNQEWLFPMIPSVGLDQSQPQNWIRALVFIIAVGTMVALSIASLLERLQNNLRNSLELIEKLEAEKHRRESMQDTMRRTERMEALGRLAGGIAHDFNNALTVMGGEADYIVGEIGENHPIGESAEVIRQATERAAILTRRLLLYGRQTEFLRPRSVNLLNIINDFLRIGRRVLPESVDVAFDRCEPSYVEVDESALHQVLLNLAINAGDAIDHEGRITLSCGTRELSEGETSLEADTYGFLRVTDTGSGIPEEELSSIFDPFFSTAKSRTSGMSLASSFGFVSASGGTIEVESTLGEGTSFTLYFPTTDKRAQNSVALLDSVTGMGKGQVALVAEDNIRVRAIIWSALTDVGFEVLEAADGEAAYKLFTESERSISVLVTDMMMPKMDGVALAKRCHKENSNLKIVLVTGYATSGASERLRKIPNTVLLPKPFGRRDLYQILNELR